VALAGGEQQELFQRGACDRRGDGKGERPAQKADGLRLDMVDIGAVFRRVWIQLVDRDELPRLLRTLEVEPVPVDYRVSPEDQAKCLEFT
jgi:hypothetical protein